MSFVKLDNLNDFIQPSTACIKPIPKTIPGKVAKVSEINLSDCLACSGCITSAESVLVQEQNHDGLFKVINDNKTGKTDKQIVASLSLQSVSSLAYKYSISAQEAAERLGSFFFSLGCHKIYDINLARHLALVESHREFVSRRSENSKLPIISSICPGWICYAEKTNGDLIIPHLSNVRSPQQIMGALLKDVDGKQRGLSRDQIFHFTIMPCFDKKLEASRTDFKDESDGTQDVDCVLTPIEIEEILRDEGVDLMEFEPRKLDIIQATGLNFDQPLSSHYGSESGGYAENILLAEASRAFGKKSDEELECSAQRNKDFIEINIRQSKESETADPMATQVGKFAVINGFRNIQTVVQRLKRKALKYDYIEVMACPSGCINGGAQCKPNAGHDQATTTEATKDIYRQVPQVPFSIDPEAPENHGLYQSLKLDDSSNRGKILYTKFQPVPKMQNLTVNW